jgi:hypothetical protein
VAATASTHDTLQMPTPTDQLVTWLLTLNPSDFTDKIPSPVLYERYKRDVGSSTGSFIQSDIAYTSGPSFGRALADLFGRTNHTGKFEAHGFACIRTSKSTYYTIDIPRMRDFLTSMLEEPRAKKRRVTKVDQSTQTPSRPPIEKVHRQLWQWLLSLDSTHDIIKVTPERLFKQYKAHVGLQWVQYTTCNSFNNAIRMLFRIHRDCRFEYNGLMAEHVNCDTFYTLDPQYMHCYILG